MAAKSIQHIALIGFGEVGGILGHDLAAQGIDVSFYDILLDSRDTREPMLAKARDTKVHAKDNLRDCFEGAELVISAVTAASAASVAKSASPLLGAGQVFLDINSVSPETKSGMASEVERGEGRFVEAAVMSAILPERLRAPMLLGGKHAEELAERLQAIGMNATIAGERIGVASAIKMCRSVMIKGLEALTVESLLAARRYGAEDAVLASLAATYPGMGWTDGLPDYLISRVAEHGRRRAAEMREAAEAVRDAGIDPLMAQATAERQDWLIDQMAAQQLDAKSMKPFAWRKVADAISGAGKKSKAS
jgi:3-hydroxyisobutyrate dehydrogenase-like beta-hydroxyacid dehydrogenase